MRENRKGFIVVSEFLAMNEWQNVQAGFNAFGFLPIRIDGDYFRGVLTYYGFSKSFREVEEAEIIPQYQIKITVKTNDDFLETNSYEIEEVK